MRIKFKFNHSIITLILAWILIMVGVFLRSWGADRYPVDNNDDGLHYSWAGINFWHQPQKPITHSIFDQNNPDLIWRSQFMDYIPRLRFGLKLVSPWQDHPPLGAAIIGLPALLLNYRPFLLIPPLVVRWPALIASIATLYLSFLLAKKLFNDKVALLSLSFLATVPYFVIAHRQSFLENFLTPLFLLGWLTGLSYLKNQKQGELIKLMIISFLGGWIKVVGFAIPWMLAVWLWVKQKKQESIKLAGIGILSLISYVGYALWVSKDSFLRALSHQGVRGAFVNSLIDGLTRPEFYGEFKDGWYVLGLILALILMVKVKNWSYSWLMAGWLIVIYLTSGRLANSPWYRYPLIPFMGMALGYWAAKLWEKNNLWLVLVFWLFGLSGLELIKIDVPILTLRLTTLGIMSIYGLNLMFKNRWLKALSSLTTKVLLGLMIIINIYVNLKFTNVHCSYEECLAPFKIVVQP